MSGLDLVVAPSAAAVDALVQHETFPGHILRMTVTYCSSGKPAVSGDSGTHSIMHNLAVLMLLDNHPN